VPCRNAWHRKLALGGRLYAHQDQPWENPFVGSSNGKGLRNEFLKGDVSLLMVMEGRSWRRRHSENGVQHIHRSALQGRTALGSLPQWRAAWTTPQACSLNWTADGVTSEAARLMTAVIATVAAAGIELDLDADPHCVDGKCGLVSRRRSVLAACADITLTKIRVGY